MPSMMARLVLLAACAATFGLAGCGSLPARGDAADAAPGISVYGTADVGWGRTGR